MSEKPGFPRAAVLVVIATALGVTLVFGYLRLQSLDSELATLHGELRQASRERDDLRTARRKTIAHLESDLDELSTRMSRVENDRRTKGPATDAGEPLDLDLLERKAVAFAKRLRDLEDRVSRLELYTTGATTADMPTAALLSMRLGMVRDITADEAVSGRKWGPEQACGPPDTLSMGDQITAWATLDADAGYQWLELSYGEVIAADAVLVRQTFNAGTVVTIELVDEHGGYHTVWAGEPSREMDFLIHLGEPFRTSRVRIQLDTDLVSGWNEIDAVALIRKGRTLWAVEATASSSYAER